MSVPLRGNDLLVVCLSETLQLSSVDKTVDTSQYESSMLLVYFFNVVLLLFVLPFVSDTWLGFTYTASLVHCFKSTICSSQSSLASSFDSLTLCLGSHYSPQLPVHYYYITPFFRFDICLLRLAGFFRCCEIFDVPLDH